MCYLKLFYILFTICACSAQDVGVLRQIRECLTQDGAVICLKETALDALNETIMSEKPLSLYGLVDIVKDPDYTPKQTEEVLPVDEAQRNIKLNEMLYNKVEEFFESRAAKINFGNLSEGRKKGGGGGKKSGMMMMGGMAVAGMMAQMFLGKIAFMAGAALLVAKLALLLSTVIGFKKLSGGGGGGGGSYGGFLMVVGGIAMAGLIKQIFSISFGFMTGVLVAFVKSVFLLMYTSMKNKMSLKFKTTKKKKKRKKQKNI